MRECKYCLHPVDEDTVFCPYCGKAIPSDMRTIQVQQVGSPIMQIDTKIRNGESTKQAENNLMICMSCGTVYRDCDPGSLCAKCGHELTDSGYSYEAWQRLSVDDKKQVFEGLKKKTISVYDTSVPMETEISKLEQNVVTNKSEVSPKKIVLDEKAQTTKKGKKGIIGLVAVLMVAVVIFGAGHFGGWLNFKPVVTKGDMEDLITRLYGIQNNLVSWNTRVAKGAIVAFTVAQGTSIDFQEYLDMVELTEENFDYELKKFAQISSIVTSSMRDYLLQEYPIAYYSVIYNRCINNVRGASASNISKAEELLLEKEQNMPDEEIIIKARALFDLLVEYKEYIISTKDDNSSMYMDVLSNSGKTGVEIVQRIEQAMKLLQEEYNKLPD